MTYRAEESKTEWKVFIVRVKIAERTLQLGVGLGLSLGTLLAVTSGVLPRFFTSDPAVITAIGNIFPFVILSQPINALAFVWDGVLYGAGGFEYAAKVTHRSPALRRQLRSAC